MVCQAPQLSVAVEWPDLDDVRVEIFRDDGDPQLAAAIELVSPRNKDRPPRGRHSRPSAPNTCVMVAGWSWSMWSPQEGRIYTLIFWPRSGADPATANTALLSAISYQPVAPGHGEGQLLAWPVELQIGQSLPTVPLWLAADLGVPLDLESSHSAACTDLRSTCLAAA